MDHTLNVNRIHPPMNKIGGEELGNQGGASLEVAARLTPGFALVTLGLVLIV